MNSKNRILCIDDDQDQCGLLEAALTRLGHTAVTTTSPHTALEQLANEPVEAVITDLGMSEMDGLTLCERIVSTRPGVPVIVLTASNTMETAISALRVGAYDFLTKPIEPKLLAVSVARAVQHSKLRAELQRLQQTLAVTSQTPRLLGDSAAMQRVQKLIERVGPSDASVLIQGETGTGKELVARAVHEASPRRNGPFVALNCAAVPGTLLESELFGHARGAFTDAKDSRQGLFLEASGGTLLLDEVGEMPLEMQTKLLRVLQERKVRPVGSNLEVPFDTRIITATHRDLEAEVRQRRFREDLFYRVNVVRVDVPPLRERGSDVLTLATHFMRTSCQRSGKESLQLSSQIADRLLGYSWPGNVRELENCMERAVALARFDHLTVEDLPEQIRAYRDDASDVTAGGPDEIVSLHEIERRHILRVLEKLHGNKARAAELLGLDRRTLYRKLERMGGTEVEPDSSELAGDDSPQQTPCHP
jgi:two-component system response regulator HydG